MATPFLWGEDVEPLAPWHPQAFPEGEDGFPSATFHDCLRSAEAWQASVGVQDRRDCLSLHEQEIVRPDGFRTSCTSLRSRKAACTSDRYGVLSFSFQSFLLQRLASSPADFRRLRTAYRLGHIRFDIVDR